MPPAPSQDPVPTDHRTWSTASVVSDSTQYRSPSPSSPSARQTVLQRGRESSTASQNFERNLNAKKDLKGGMTKRWLKEDFARDEQREYRRAVALLEGKSVR